LQFVNLATIAEISATPAGFATLASAIRGIFYDADAVFDVAGHSLSVLAFTLCGSLFGSSAGALRVLGPILAGSLDAVRCRSSPSITPRWPAR
jgi:hypothetical protein